MLAQQALPGLRSKFLAGYGKVDPVHAGHCVQYLAEAILCAGDMTLEPAKLSVVNGKRRWNVDAATAFVTEHRCYDVDVIYEYLHVHSNLTWEN